MTTQPQIRQTPWVTSYAPPRQEPVICRCGATMAPTLDVARRWKFSDDLQPAPRTWIDDYTARSWDCPRCGRRLDQTQCWSEPVPLRTGETPCSPPEVHP